MRFFATVSTLLLSACACAAEPQGSWPEDMRGAGLPKPQWIMVIPAFRNADGSVSVWDRSLPWSNEWIVPKATPSGVRTVAVNGDSEDRRIVSAAQIDNMSVSALSRLAGKYGAGAIAVAVADPEGRVAVAAWSRGRYATWDMAASEGPDTAREAALTQLDAIYSGDAARPPGADADGGKVEIVAERFNGLIGATEFRLRASQEVLDAVAGSSALTVTARRRGEGVVDVVVNGDRDIEQVLEAEGFDLR